MGVSSWPVSGDRERELLLEVLSSDRWGGYHPIVKRFEQEFAAFQQCQFGVAASNGTVTLEMALAALGIGPGDEVIVPAISFISTATAVSRVGATPVFVDIEADTFQIDSQAVRTALSKSTRAIMAVHFGGPMANMDQLGEIAAEAGVTLVEDAAHAHGAEWKGRRAGSIGQVGSFSFQNSKVMTAGEGGILTTNDAEVEARMRSIGDQGRIAGGDWFSHHEIGTNYRMTAWQAAVLIAQLERLPEQNCLRAANARYLRTETRDVPGLHWQTIADEALVHTNYLALGRIPDRDRFAGRLQSSGVPCTPFYPHTLYNNPVYLRGGCRVQQCPAAEARITDAFWLPHRVLLGTPEDMRTIVQKIREAASR
jgi:dTDP-4-amino-4,6-dideoxygalactose transaminase